MFTETVNLKTLQTLVHRMMRNGVTYGLGHKAGMDWPIDRIHSIDCSGFVRYLLFHSTKDHLLLPDGSWNQRDWCIKNHLTRVSYSEVGNEPKRLYLAFLDPHPVGHVWFVNDGWTMESHGGRGPNERHWDTPLLKREVDYCFILPHIWE